MNKKLISVIALFLVKGVQAQTFIAPEAGFQMVNMRFKLSQPASSEPMFGYKPSFRAGINIATTLSPVVSLEGGLFYAAKGFKEEAYGKTVSKLNLNYIDVPVYLNLTVLNKKGNKLFAGIGPYVSYCVGGTSKTDLALLDPSLTGIDKYKMEIGNDAATDDIKPFDLGANANVGFLFSMGLYVRAQYSLGLFNTIPGGDKNASLKNRAFGISFGYRIKL